MQFECTQKSKKTAPSLPPGWKTKPTSQKRLLHCDESKKPTSQKSSTAFNPPNLKIPGLDAQPRAATSGHKFPTIYRFLIQIYANLRNIFTKPVPPLDPSALDPQNLKISSPKVLPCAAMHPKQSHDLSNDPWLSPLNLCKSAHNFRNLTIPWFYKALDRQNPKKFETKKAVKRRHVPPTTPAFITSNSRVDVRHLHHITCSHVPRAIPWPAPQLYDIMDDVSWPDLTDLEIWPGSELPKKKRERENTLTKWTFDLDQKVKITRPTQFFEYIPILGPVSSFETKKCCKLSKFQKVDFFTNFDQESKFSRKTYLAQFFAKIPILGSISSFENLKFLKYCDSKAFGFNVNFDQESRCSSKACPIEIFT